MLLSWWWSFDCWVRVPHSMNWCFLKCLVISWLNTYICSWCYLFNTEIVGKDGTSHVGKVCVNNLISGWRLWFLLGLPTQSISSSRLELEEKSKLPNCSKCSCPLATMATQNHSHPIHGFALDALFPVLSSRDALSQTSDPRMVFFLVSTF